LLARLNGIQNSPSYGYSNFPESLENDLQNQESWFENREKKEKETFHFSKSGNVLRKGNYSVFGLKEKELGCEIK